MSNGNAITTLSNKDVTDMLTAGIDPSYVVRIIFATPKQTFDVSVQALVALGTAKVPIQVINAMTTKVAQGG